MGARWGSEEEGRGVGGVGSKAGGLSWGGTARGAGGEEADRYGSF